MVGIVEKEPKSEQNNTNEDDPRYGIQLLELKQGWKEEQSQKKTNKSLVLGGKIIVVKRVNLKKPKRDSVS